ncbi:NUDIX hydrolase [Erysipelotrichaceae bacterium 51-3]|uniref:NUDIX hydrolase n=1 Tax=Allobaculum sp. JKK-2023 TaxID=3108943 RepID=UPI002B0616DF|nr:NUDIX hydrolase [Allobaculum sp. JKK-2023]
MSTKEIFDGKIFSVVQKEMEVNGALMWRDLVIHPGGAAISVIVDHKILLVRQTRAGIGNVQTLEIPAGTIDAGEDPMVTANRELNEETGCKAESLSLITAFWPTPGYDSEVIYVYQAHGVSKAEHRLAMDDTEDITLVWMDLEEAYQKIAGGEIRDGKTILAIYHAKLQELEAIREK